MEKIYDLIIIGAGPAGLTAAIYASRSNLSVLIIESAVNGGKLSKTYEIENYPGINKISGLQLAEQLTSHGQQFGAKLISGEVDDIKNNGETKTILLKDNSKYESKTVIIATGTKERTLNLENADNFTGRGISYCAVCDGFFYRNKDVVVIGGGNSALEESLFLASLVNKITIVIRKDVFRADGKVVDKVKENEKIEIITKHLPEQLLIEDDMIKGLKIKDVDSGEISTIKCSGIFPYIGADPCTEFVDKSILNENGYIKTNPDMSTAIKGIYAAGDCIEKDLRQVVTACNDGAIAANSVVKYLK